MLLVARGGGLCVASGCALCGAKAFQGLKATV